MNRYCKCEAARTRMLNAAERGRTRKGYRESQYCQSEAVKCRNNRCKKRRNSWTSIANVKQGRAGTIAAERKKKNVKGNRENQYCQSEAALSRNNRRVRRWRKKLHVACPSHQRCPPLCVACPAGASRGRVRHTHGDTKLIYERENHTRSLVCREREKGRRMKEREGGEEKNDPRKQRQKEKRWW